MRRLALAAEHPLDAALRVELDDHVRALVDDPDVVLLVDADRVGVRPGRSCSCRSRGRTCRWRRTRAAAPPGPCRRRRSTLPRENTKTCFFELTATPAISPKWMSLGIVSGFGHRFERQLRHRRLPRRGGEHDDGRARDRKDETSHNDLLDLGDAAPGGRRRPMVAAAPSRPARRLECAAQEDRHDPPPRPRRRARRRGRSPRRPSLTAQSGTVTLRAPTLLDGRGGIALRRDGHGERRPRSPRSAPSAGAATYDLDRPDAAARVHRHARAHRLALRRQRPLPAGPEPADQAALYGAENAYVTLMAGFTTVQSVGAAVGQAAARGAGPRRHPRPAAALLARPDRQSQADARRDPRRDPQEEGRRRRPHQDLRLGQHPRRRRADAVAGAARRGLRRGARRRGCARWSTPTRPKR